MVVLSWDEADHQVTGGSNWFIRSIRSCSSGALSISVPSMMEVHLLANADGLSMDENGRHTEMVLPLEVAG